MGIVHHSAYVPWFELGRIRWLSELGLPYAELERQGRQIPVLGLQVEYKKPIHFGGEIRLGVGYRQISAVKFQFCYEVWSQNLLCTMASTEHVVVENGRPVRIPSWLTEKM